MPERDQQRLLERRAAQGLDWTIRRRRRRRQGRRAAAELAEKQIIKEGLSEYFIYTIEGTETIPNGWSKRMRSLEAAAVPFKIQYRYRPQEYGEQLVRMYLLTNNKESKLGTSPLPDGVVRVFRDNGRDGLSYLDAADDQVHPDRRQDRAESRSRSGSHLRADQAQDVPQRHLAAAQRHERVSQARRRRPSRSSRTLSVVGWDDHEIYTQRIRNYTAKPIDVEIRRPFDGHVTFRSLLEPKLHDYRTVQFAATVAAGKKADLMFEIIRRQGHNAKQNNVTLEQGEVKP